MKICRKCGIEFNTKACNPCEKIRAAKYRLEHAEKIKENYQLRKLKNPTKKYDQNKKWESENPETVRLYKENWRKSNLEKVNETSKKWNKKNFDKCVIQRAERYKNNPEKYKARSKKYYLEHPETFRICRQNRRARMLSAGGILSKDITHKLLKYQQGKCACCKIDLKIVKIHLDHIMPLALGGTNTDNNIQLLCQPCNNQKHAKDPILFMQSRGFLI